MPNAAPGYVYVLFNPAFPDLVKIGRTADGGERRARTLSRATAVPLAFIVVHEEWVPGAAALERALHRRFARRRVSRRREFFRLPVKDAVRALVDEAARRRGRDRTFAPRWRGALPVKTPAAPPNRGGTLAAAVANR